MGYVNEKERMDIHKCILDGRGNELGLDFIEECIFRLYHIEELSHKQIRDKYSFPIGLSYQTLKSANKKIKQFQSWYRKERLRQILDK